MYVEQVVAATMVILLCFRGFGKSLLVLPANIWVHVDEALANTVVLQVLRVCCWCSVGVYVAEVVAAGIATLLSFCCPVLALPYNVCLYVAKVLATAILILLWCCDCWRLLR